MAASNGHVEIPNVVEDYHRQLLTANQQITDALVTVGKGYQQAFETSVRFSFAQVKALNELFTPKAE
ncbi:MAG: hypothetical protein EXR47_05305 [Dehalococcoidia bacterium]|nr:hypothetical protein [Dehalococcoidia bacterium]